MARVYAQVCCYCPDRPEHPIADRDRWLLEQGARPSHGMCPEAKERFDAELDALDAAET